MGGKCVQVEVGIRVMLLQPKEYVGPPGIRMGKDGPWKGSVSVQILRPHAPGLWNCEKWSCCLKP